MSAYCRPLQSRRSDARVGFPSGTPNSGQAGLNLLQGFSGLYHELVHTARRSYGRKLAKWDPEGCGSCRRGDVLYIERTRSCRNAATKSTARKSCSSSEFASLISALQGRWQTLVYYGEHQEGGGSREAPDHGERVWRTGPGGLTLMEEEHMATRGGDRYLFALHWWDRSTNSLKGILCNNSGPEACKVDSYYRSKLNWDGKRLTIDLIFPQGAKLML